MVKKVAYLSAILLGLLFTASCVINFPEGISGNGKVEVETRDISDFNAIEASSGIIVYITFGEKASLKVEADENLLDVIRTEVSGGTLRIYADKSIRHEKAKNVRITVPSLEEIEVSSAADVRGENVLKTDRLDISVSSAGELRLETEAESIRANASSSGSIDIRGEAKELEATASSASTIDADKLKSETCLAKASSAGTVRVWVTDNLTAEASSAGSVNYQGEPKNVKIDTSSAGSVSGDKK